MKNNEKEEEKNHQMSLTSSLLVFLPVATLGT
jgi:hypothetical protein